MKQARSLADVDAFVISETEKWRKPIRSANIVASCIAEVARWFALLPGWLGAAFAPGQCGLDLTRKIMKTEFCPEQMQLRETMLQQRSSAIRA